MTKTDAKRLKLTRSLEEAHALADAVLSRARAHSRRTAPKRAERVKAKEGKRADRNERMADIRYDVFNRASGRCELCGDPASEAHHVVGGGLRRIKESVETVLALCAYCHQDIHHGNPNALTRAHVFCTDNGMDEAAAALAKRLGKVEEARKCVTR